MGPTPDTPPGAAPSPGRPRGSTLLLVSAICALIVVVAAFMPWATALGFISVSGTTGDGAITLALGLIGMILAVWGSGRVLPAPANTLIMPVLSTIAGGLVAIIAGIDLGNIGAQLEEAGGLVTPGAGLILTLLFGIAWFALSMTAIFRRD